jgi:hypothetical protein
MMAKLSGFEVLVGAGAFTVSLAAVILCHG